MANLGQFIYFPVESVQTRDQFQSTQDEDQILERTNYTILRLKLNVWFSINYYLKNSKFDFKQIDFVHLNSFFN